MLEKLTAKALAGERGWDDISDDDLRERLVDDLLFHIEKAKVRNWGSRDCVDIANYCMMIARLEKERLTP